MNSFKKISQAFIVWTSLASGALLAAESSVPNVPSVQDALPVPFQTHSGVLVGSLRLEDISQIVNSAAWKAATKRVYEIENTPFVQQLGTGSGISNEVSDHAEERMRITAAYADLKKEEFEKYLRIPRPYSYCMGDEPNGTDDPKYREFVSYFNEASQEMGYDLIIPVSLAQCSRMGVSAGAPSEVSPSLQQLMEDSTSSSAPFSQVREARRLERIKTFFEKKWRHIRTRTRSRIKGGQVDRHPESRPQESPVHAPLRNNGSDLQPAG